MGVKMRRLARERASAIRLSRGRTKVKAIIYKIRQKTAYIKKCTKRLVKAKARVKAIGRSLVIARKSEREVKSRRSLGRAINQHEINFARVSKISISKSGKVRVHPWNLTKAFARIKSRLTRQYRQRYGQARARRILAIRRILAGTIQRCRRIRNAIVRARARRNYRKVNRLKRINLPKCLARIRELRRQLARALKY